MKTNTKDNTSETLRDRPFHFLGGGGAGGGGGVRGAGGVRGVGGAGRGCGG